MFIPQLKVKRLEARPRPSINIREPFGMVLMIVTRLDYSTFVTKQFLQIGRRGGTHPRHRPGPQRPTLRHVIAQLEGSESKLGLWGLTTR